MNKAFQYQTVFDDTLSKEFRTILSVPPRFKATDITGCSLWLDSSDSTTLIFNSNQMLNWQDKTTGKNFAPPSSSNAPILGKKINGYDTIEFLSAISYLQYTGSITYQECFVVCELQDNNLISQIIGSYSEGIHLAVDMRGSEAVSGLFSFDGNNVLSLTAQYALNNSNYSPLFYANTTASEPRLTIGIPQSIACIWSNIATTTTHYIGALLPSIDILIQSLAGVLAEIIVYDRLLSDPERQSVRTYLNNKWGIL